MSRYTQKDIQELEQSLKSQGRDVDDPRVRRVLEMLDALGHSIDANALDQELPSLKVKDGRYG